MPSSRSAGVLVRTTFALAVCCTAAAFAETEPSLTPQAASSRRTTAAIPSGIRAKFFQRIQEMLVEATALEAAGRPGDAMLMGIRASRMLNVIGGEPAWPREEASAGRSPGEFLALLAQRYGPEVLQSARPETAPLPAAGSILPESGSPASPQQRIVDEKGFPPPRRAIQSSGAVQGSGVSPVSPSVQPDTARQVDQEIPTTAVNSEQSSAETSRDPFDRFPKIPAKPRAWVPVGEKTAAKDHWMPLPETPEIQQTEAEYAPASPTPIRVFEPAPLDQSDVVRNLFEPIPDRVHQADRPDENAVDIRADESQPDGTAVSAETDAPAGTAEPLIRPRDLPGDFRPVPAQQPGTAVSSSAELTPRPSLEAKQPVPSFSEPAAGSSNTPEQPADSSHLVSATVTGALGGILLVLVGAFVMRRLAKPAGAASSAATAAAPLENLRLADEARLPEPEFRQGNDSEVSWVPGYSWGESQQSQGDSKSLAPVACQTECGEGDGESVRLQVFHGDPESGKPESAAVASDNGSHVDRQEAPDSATRVGSIVPFRVVGTDVVLGESESARVDEELELRRQKILQRIIEENSAMQERLAESDDSREAA